MKWFQRRQANRARGRRTLRVCAMALAVLLALSPYLYHQNNDVSFSHYRCENARLPEAFEGYTFLQVSDLHNKSLRRQLPQVLERCEAAGVDAVAVTGDAIDSPHIENALSLMSALSQRYPVYYVPGNHEALIPKSYATFKQRLVELGVVLLEDRSVMLTRGEASIALLGLTDPAFDNRGLIHGQTGGFAGRLKALHDPTHYTVLLSHRPELFELYAQAGVELTLSGHEHGGLVRLPRVGALVALNQGLLPQYTEGIHYQGTSALVISRGLGNSPFFVSRINNPPELVLVTLTQGH